MLVLLFSIGDDRYGLPVAAVVEVVPLLKLKGMPGAPACVAGLCNFRGQPIPVIDLSAVAGGRAGRPLLSTRIVVVDYPLPAGGSRLLGLLAERATETALIDEADLRPSGVEVDDAPFLGKVAVAAGEMVQLVEIGGLLPPAVAALLFREDQAA